MLAVLVERQLPRHLLWRRVDLHRAAEVAHGGEHVARHVGHRPVGGQRDPGLPPVAVLGDRLVALEVERDDDRAGAVGRRQRERLPPARAQPQGGVLELRLGRGERRGQLAEDLRVGVQRVAVGSRTRSRAPATCAERYRWCRRPR